MSDKTETAVLAGGCAWIMQQLLRYPEGVISTRTGFMGGENDNPTEEDNGGHAEVVEVIFDPERLRIGDYSRCSARSTEPTLMKAWLVPCTARRSSTQARSSEQWPTR